MKTEGMDGLSSTGAIALRASESTHALLAIAPWQTSLPPGTGSVEDTCIVGVPAAAGRYQ